MSKEFGVFWGPEIYNYRDIKRPIIKHILYENDTICISSRAGAGKSILALQLIFCLTTGRDFLETFKVERPFNVLYLQTEGDRSETLERIKSMKNALKIDDNKWVHINLDGIFINTPEGVDKLIKLAKTPKVLYDVTIIDPLYTTVKGTMSNDEVATAWIVNIRRFRAEFGCAIIVLNHDHKDSYFQGKVIDKANDNIFGAFSWGAFFNQNFKFKVVGGIHYLDSGKRRSGGKIIDRVEMKMVEPDPLLFVLPDEDTNLTYIKISSILKNNKDKKYTVKDLVEITQVSVPSAYRAINRIKNNNFLGEEKGKYWWEESDK